MVRTMDLSGILVLMQERRQGSGGSSPSRTETMEPRGRDWARKGGRGGKGGPAEAGGQVV